MTHLWTKNTQLDISPKKRYRCGARGRDHDHPAWLWPKISQTCSVRENYHGQTREPPWSRGLFKRLQILPLPCEYIFSLLNFIINNQEHFQINSVVHSVNTRNKNHLHRPVASLTGFQKSTYYSGINIFNNLPSSLKSPMNEKATFKVALKIYLNTHSFYSVDEFLVSKTVSSS
jgi:hypothetical protein